MEDILLSLIFTLADFILLLLYLLLLLSLLIILLIILLLFIYLIFYYLPHFGSKTDIITSSCQFNKELYG